MMVIFLPVRHPMATVSTNLFNDVFLIQELICCPDTSHACIMKRSKSIVNQDLLAVIDFCECHCNDVFNKASAGDVFE